ncbi:hypothetical protein, partial [Amycolatopsis sp. SID8362]|uniref:hypothetical protein n=1 Tax=Amycolatopsis sp. SID8362 TaxID=2690346 RepID=UPI0019445EF6
ADERLAAREGAEAARYARRHFDVRDTWAGLAEVTLRRARPCLVRTEPHPVAGGPPAADV